MIVTLKERLIIEKQIPIQAINTEPKEKRLTIDPFSLPPIRDVFEPLISVETVRFNPFNGEVFVLGQKNEQNQTEIDNLDPKKQSFWLNYSRLDDACSACKGFYTERGRSGLVENTEEVIDSVIGNLPQLSEAKLNESIVLELITDIHSKLLSKGIIFEGENYEYFRRALYYFRGIRRWHYSEEEKKSRLVAAFLNIVNDLIGEKGKDPEDYSPTLVNL